MRGAAIMTEMGRSMPRGKETKGAEPRDIFVPVALDLDARALFEGRGEAIEPGLSIIDTQVPIAGLGEVDLVGIDAARRLVVIDLAGAGEAAEEDRALAHATWFRDNLPVVRRMYQLWNVRWDAPIRIVWISGEPIGSRESETAEGEGFVLDRLVVTPMRTRDGREAVFLSSSMPPATVAHAPIARVAPAARPIRTPALREIEVTATPASPRAGRQAAEFASDATGVPDARASRPARTKADLVEEEASWGEEFRAGANDFHGEGASVEGAPLRGEAYRRELGLTQDEFTEFFVGPRVAARPAQGGGNQ